MIQDIKFIIREKKRGEWLALFKKYLDTAFVWIDKNGKIGVASAFIAGILSVLAFKLVFAVLLLCALIAGVILLIAEP